MDPTQNILRPGALAPVIALRTKATLFTVISQRLGGELWLLEPGGVRHYYDMNLATRPPVWTPLTASKLHRELLYTFTGAKNLTMSISRSTLQTDTLSSLCSGAMDQYGMQVAPSSAGR
jgi:hypothetical protein